MQDALRQMTGIEYPYEDEPELATGVAREVALGILWFRMPVHAGVRSVNVWAIPDGDSWTLIDTGISSWSTARSWEVAFAGALRHHPITRIIATHLHPDHCGMAGWLCERFQARLWMTRSEYLTARLLAADAGSRASSEAVAFWRLAGWSEEAIGQHTAAFGAPDNPIYPLPSAYRRMVADELIPIGQHMWTVLEGRGHSLEHACLYCPEQKLFISGDIVLPTISPNISVSYMEPDANPMGDWMECLEALKRRVPDDVLVLPSHGKPFRGLHNRLSDLKLRHERALARLLPELAEPKRVVDIFPILFKRPIRLDVLRLATGEALAHLHYLQFLGEAKCFLDTSGVKYWQRR